MKYVFRVENDLGEGPFNGTPNFPDDFDIWDHYSGEYPARGADRLPNNPYYLSGCPNACSLLYWFGQHMELVLKTWHIYRLDVKDYFLGTSGTQVVYHENDVINKTEIYVSPY